MRYGHFDNTNREYVIERPDVPVSWTNYIGVENLCTVISHNAGGYSFYKHAEHQRVTRFRPNGVPLDRPGHYVYLRDDNTGEYWSISWQPVGKDLAQAKYECRHGLSYSKFSCDYREMCIRDSPERVIKLDLDLALAAGVVERRDFTNEYVDAVESLIDLEAIRNAGLKLIVDPMYGVGQLTLGTVLTEARCRVTFIHERHNPLFGGRSPAPDAEALRLLSSTMRDDGYDLGLAMDGDADRKMCIRDRFSALISTTRGESGAASISSFELRAARSEYTCVAMNRISGS